MSQLKSPTEIDEFLKTIPKERIVSRECKHVTPSNHRFGERSDCHTVKEWVTLDDGSRWPTIRKFVDYKRPYWITKPHLRTHPDKIGFEDTSRTDLFYSTQINLAREICGKLGRGNPTNGLRMIARSPYVYGTDAGAEVFLKQNYMYRWPDTFLPNKVTFIDAETDVNCLLHQEKDLPILWSHVDDDEIVVYVNKDWTFDIPNYADQLREEYLSVIDEWIGVIRKKMSNKKGEYPVWIDAMAALPLRIVMCKDHFDATKQMIDHLHYTQPDIVSGWNFFFDATVMVTSIEEAGWQASDVLSDPRVPPQFRHAYLKEGPLNKISDAGREMRLEPQERWHKVITSASWKMQDGMQLFWQLRKAKGKESGGYGLEAVLRRQFGVGKLKYKTEDTTIPQGTKHWHMEMQAKYKVRYGAYNIIDSLGTYALDKKNSDLSSQISSLAGPCDYSKFNSQPTINSIDMMFSILKKRNKIICSTSDEMRNELDDLTHPKSGWIITFPSHAVVDTGVFIYADMPTIRSMIHMFCADADVETTYPTLEIILNLSKETTLVEPCKIAGISREKLRLASVNLTAGKVNAIDIMQSCCNAPTMDEVLEAVRRRRAAA